MQQQNKETQQRDQKTKKTNKNTITKQWRRHTQRNRHIEETHKRVRDIGEKASRNHRGSRKTDLSEPREA
jgi:hypothetical protein